MKSVDWLRIFADADFRFRMGLRRGDIGTFFAKEAGWEDRLRLRREGLSKNPLLYCAARPESDEAVLEGTELMLGSPVDPQGSSAEAICLEAGTRIDADWVLLGGDPETHHPVMAGCVCFPSSWSLPEKLGQPIEAVHRPVPTVSEELHPSIHTFLERLQPGIGWERENWGLAADDRLDHHSTLPRRHLEVSATLATTWLRLERQLLTRLPRSSAILFGIRISIHRLDELVRIPGLAPRIARALRTMPGDIARYKGLGQCRETLADQLTPV